MITTSTEPSRPAVERSPPTGGRLQIGMAEIKSESVADFIPESVADLLRNQQATHTGWSLRANGYGEGDLSTIQGSMIPFATTEAERQRAGDPRPSLESRYTSRDVWGARLAAAADRLVADRLLLPEDGDRLLAAARESWDVYQAL